MEVTWGRTRGVKRGKEQKIKNRRVMADTERQRGKCSEREKMGDGERETDMDWERERDRQKERWQRE